jgi:ketosteroid isomerase-like protein
MKPRVVPVLVLVFGALAAAGARAVPAARAGIESLNRVLADASRRMDRVALGALWEADGIRFRPLAPPLVGRAAIRRELEAAAARMPGAQVAAYELECHDIRVSGDAASEWCAEHSVVTLPGRKVPFDAHDVLLLVLHRGADRVWRLSREMRNAAAAGGSDAP